MDQRLRGLNLCVALCVRAFFVCVLRTRVSACVFVRGFMPCTKLYSHAICMSLSAPNGVEGSLWGWAAKENRSNAMQGCISCEMVLQFDLRNAL